MHLYVQQPTSKLYYPHIFPLQMYIYCQSKDIGIVPGVGLLFRCCILVLFVCFSNIISHLSSKKEKVIL